MCANIFQFKLCGGQLLGPKLGLESVDADTVGYNFGFAVGVDDGFLSEVLGTHSVFQSLFW